MKRKKKWRFSLEVLLMEPVITRKAYYTEMNILSNEKQSFMIGHT